MWKLYPPLHYFSHLFVLRPDSETTPIRVVFVDNAFSRLQQLQNRLLKLNLWQPYASIIAEQIDKGYVEAVPTTEDPSKENDWI